MQGWLSSLLIVIYHSTLLSASAIAQPTQVPSASQQIAAALLPLPEVMREHATVLGYAPDLSLVTLREGTNGMVCTASRPGDAEFGGLESTKRPVDRSLFLLCARLV